LNTYIVDSLKEDVLRTTVTVHGDCGLVLEEGVGAGAAEICA